MAKPVLHRQSMIIKYEAIITCRTSFVARFVRHVINFSVNRKTISIKQNKWRKKKLLRQESIIFTHSIFEAKGFHNSLFLMIMSRSINALRHIQYYCSYIYWQSEYTEKATYLRQLTDHVYHLKFCLVYRVHWAGVEPKTYICRFKCNYIARSLLSVLKG